MPELAPTPMPPAAPEYIQAWEAEGSPEEGNWKKAAELKVGDRVVNGSPHHDTYQVITIAPHLEEAGEKVTYLNVTIAKSDDPEVSHYSADTQMLTLLPTDQVLLAPEQP